MSRERVSLVLYVLGSLCFLAGSLLALTRGDK